MTPFEIAGLKWLADFVKGVGSGVLGDRLKPKSREENARSASMALFDALGDLVEASDGFVAALRRASTERMAARKELPDSLLPVRRSLQAVEKALHRLSPQLKLQAPDIDAGIREVRGSRSGNIALAEVALRDLADEESDVDLASLAIAAEEAGNEIRSTADALRRFLADQFSYRDSFKGP